MQLERILGTTALLSVVIVASACGSSSRTTTPTTVGTAPSSTPAVRASTSVRASTTSQPATTVSPNAPEINAAGDIPDNQTFVRYHALDGAYSFDVPEGWARTTSSSSVTFSDHFNSVAVSAHPASAAPTVATVRASDVPSLERATPGFALRDVTSVTRSAGPAVLLTYGMTSASDPVTGKRIALDVERYEFWRNGKLAMLTLSAPHGADNVDPWKRVTDSFSWAR